MWWELRKLEDLVTHPGRETGPRSHCRGMTGRWLSPLPSQGSSTEPGQPLQGGPHPVSAPSGAPGLKCRFQGHLSILLTRSLYFEQIDIYNPYTPCPLLVPKEKMGAQRCLRRPLLLHGLRVKGLGSDGLLSGSALSAGLWRRGCPVRVN